MAERRVIRLYDVFTITSRDGSTQATLVPDKGATITSLTMPDSRKHRELLVTMPDNFWQKNNEDLLGGLTLLFPICGRLSRHGTPDQYYYEGKFYTMPSDGFAWRLPWQIIDSWQPDRIVLRLQDNKQTHEWFPFNFEINLTYQVEFRLFRCEVVFTNTGTQMMPYCAGFLPWFVTPMPGHGKEKMLLQCDPIRRYQFMPDYPEPLQEFEMQSWPMSIVQPDLNGQSLQLGENNAIQLIYPDEFLLELNALSQDVLTMFPYVGLSTDRKKPYFITQLGTSLPNAFNSFRGARWLLPGQSERATFTITSQTVAV